MPLDTLNALACVRASHLWSVRASHLTSAYTDARTHTQMPVHTLNAHVLDAFEKLDALTHTSMPNAHFNALTHTQCTHVLDALTHFNAQRTLNAHAHVMLLHTLHARTHLMLLRKALPVEPKSMCSVYTLALLLPKSEEDTCVIRGGGYMSYLRLHSSALVAKVCRPKKKSV
jgi:hypothetical protein